MAPGDNWARRRSIKCVTEAGLGSSSWPRPLPGSIHINLSVSSTKSGLPPVRCFSAGAKAAPTSPGSANESTNSASAGSLSGRNTTACSRARPASASAISRKGVPASAARQASAQRNGLSLSSSRARMRSRLAASAKCRSSSSKPDTPCCAPSRWASSRCKRRRWSTAAPGAWDSCAARVGAFQVMARPPAASGVCACAKDTARNSRAKVASGTPASPGRADTCSTLGCANSLLVPERTWPKSCIKRVLPMPASPVTATTWPARQPCSNSCSSVWRPIMRGGRNTASGTVRVATAVAAALAETMVARSARVSAMGDTPNS